MGQTTKQEIKTALEKTESPKLHFVWELHKNPIDLKKGIARFANKNFTWYIGKTSELKTKFPDTDDTRFAFCNASIPIIVMKSKQTTSWIFEMKSFIANAFETAKKAKINLSEYDEWLIHEHHSLNQKIECETCGTINECDKEMSFSQYCSGTMEWKHKPISCWATFHFSDHAYRITEYNLEEMKLICFDDDGKQCWINACCKLGHKDHDYMEVADEGRRPHSWFETIKSCVNCGARGVEIKTDWQKLAEALFEKFVEQYETYWVQDRTSSVMMAKGNTDRQREIHDEIKNMVEGDMMIVQHSLQRAESKYGTFSRIVVGSMDRKEAMAKIYDYAGVSVKYLIRYELGYEGVVDI